jgi:hypothetical protein
VVIEAITASPYTQRSFETADFREFVRTVRERGHLSNLPLIRPLNDGQYEIISGHKRYETARQAGLKRIAAEIREPTDWEATTVFLDEHVATKPRLQPTHTVVSTRKHNSTLHWTHFRKTGVTSNYASTRPSPGISILTRNIRTMRRARKLKRRTTQPTTNPQTGGSRHSRRMTH